jgi:ankyrin repeat protein
MQDINGWTALMYACRYSNENNSKIVNTLLENYEVNINMRNIEGESALIIACRYSLDDSNNETIGLLIDYGADVNIQNNKKERALKIICGEKYNFDAILMLLSRG